MRDRDRSSAATTCSRSSWVTLRSSRSTMVATWPRSRRRRTPAPAATCRASSHAPDRHHRREHVAAPPACCRSPTASSASYMHNKVATDLGKIGVLVALESTRRQGQARGARQAARHACGVGQPAVADRRRPRPGPGRARARGAEPRRPARAARRADIIAKMVEGGIRKFHQEVVLLRAGLHHGRQDQGFEGRRRCRQAGRRPGPHSAGYLRFALGEGIEKKSRTSRQRWLPSSEVV